MRGRLMPASCCLRSFTTVVNHHRAWGKAHRQAMWATTSPVLSTLPQTSHIDTAARLSLT